MLDNYTLEEATLVLNNGLHWFYFTYFARTIGHHDYRTGSWIKKLARAYEKYLTEEFKIDIRYRTEPGNDIEGLRELEILQCSGEALTMLKLVTQ